MSYAFVVGDEENVLAVRIFGNIFRFIRRNRDGTTVGLLVERNRIEGKRFVFFSLSFLNDSLDTLIGSRAVFAGFILKRSGISIFRIFVNRRLYHDLPSAIGRRSEELAIGGRGKILARMTLNVVDRSAGFIFKAAFNGHKLKEISGGQVGRLCKSLASQEPCGPVGGRVTRLESIERVRLNILCIIYRSCSVVGPIACRSTCNTGHEHRSGGNQIVNLFHRWIEIKVKD